MVGFIGSISMLNDLNRDEGYNFVNAQLMVLLAMFKLPLQFKVGLLNLKCDGYERL